MADSFNRFLERSGKARGAFAIALQEMKRNALSGLATYTRHTSQGIDHSNQER
jgi:hypothetical protein